ADAAVRVQRPRTATANPEPRNCLWATSHFLTSDNSLARHASVQNGLSQRSAARSREAAPLGGRTMSRSEIDHCHEALQTKEVELSSTLSRRGEISIEKVADALDDIQYTRERELAISNLDRVSKLLRCVRAALARIENGSYGISPRCDSAINPRRLRA